MQIRQRFLSTLIFLAFISEAMAQGLVNEYQQFMAVYNEKNYSRCSLLGIPLANSTDHPGIQYKLAECLCQIGQTNQSLALLDTLSKRGLTYNVEANKLLSPLFSNQHFQEYAKQFKKNRSALDKSVISFIVNDSLLIPEGIAFDPHQQAFYIGSLAKQKVIRCSGKGNCEDFVLGTAHGFWMVVGMKVSDDNKSLWICSASERDTIDGYAGIFQFEIPSGKLLKKYTLDNRNGPHLFNDIVFTGSGDIYFTDSRAGKVWRTAPGSDTLQEYAAGYVYPNGIAIDEASKALFLADFTGLHMIDLNTGQQTRMNHQHITYLNGIDGLYCYKGTLIAIQDSGNQDDRIVQFNYDVKKGLVTKAKTLQSFRKDFITPTTGTIIDNEFHYIANAQLRSLQPDGSLANPEKLVKPVILKLKLD